MYTKKIFLTILVISIISIFYFTILSNTASADTLADKYTVEAAENETSPVLSYVEKKAGENVLIGVIVLFILIVILLIMKRTPTL